MNKNLNQILNPSNFYLSNSGPTSKLDIQYQKAVETRLDNIARLLRVFNFEEGSEFIFMKQKKSSGDCFLCRVKSMPMQSSCIIDFDIIASSCEDKIKTSFTIHDFKGRIILPSSCHEYRDEYDKCKERILSEQSLRDEKKVKNTKH